MDDNFLFLVERLKSEFKQLNRQGFYSSGLQVGLFDKFSYYKWRAFKSGPVYTSYKGGLFYMKLTFPKNYPFSPPEIRFLTPIYHLNVNSVKGSNLGVVKLPIFEYWTPSNTIRELITKLFTIFYYPNTNYYFDQDKTIEFIKHRDLYESKIKYFTKKYANPLDKDIFHESWCFSCYDYIFNPINFIPEEEQIVTCNKFDNNNNESINIAFHICETGFRIPINCKSNELSYDIVKKFEKIYSPNFEFKPLYIYSSKKLNLDVSIGSNSIKNHEAIAIINISYCYPFIGVKNKILKKK
jgi:ubiquitin-protein ligase